MIKSVAKSGRRGDIEETFKDSIAAAGFTNVHQKQYKVPIGNWAKNPALNAVKWGWKTSKGGDPRRYRRGNNIHLHSSFCGNSKLILTSPIVLYDVFDQLWGT